MNPLSLTSSSPCRIWGQKGLLLAPFPGAIFIPELRGEHLICLSCRLFKSYVQDLHPFISKWAKTENIKMPSISFRPAVLFHPPYTDHCCNQWCTLLHAQYLPHSFHSAGDACCKFNYSTFLSTPRLLYLATTEFSLNYRLQNNFFLSISAMHMTKRSEESKQLTFVFKATSIKWEKLKGNKQKLRTKISGISNKRWLIYRWPELW